MDNLAMMYIDTSKPFPLEQLKNICDISKDLMLKALHVSNKAILLTRIMETKRTMLKNNVFKCYVCNKYLVYEEVLSHTNPPNFDNVLFDCDGTFSLDGKKWYKFPPTENQQSKNLQRILNNGKKQLMMKQNLNLS